MKKILFLVFLTTLGTALAQEANPLGGEMSQRDGAFPGPLPPVPPQFTATLDGANAIPPNNSVFTATATAGPPVPFPFAPYIYWVYVEVDFPLSLLTNNPNIRPDWPSIQKQDGSLVEDPYCAPGDCPFILEPPLPPLIPFCNGCVNPPFIPTGFSGRFAITPEQFDELAKGQWYVNATFATSNGIPLPDQTIRGQILPVDSDNDGIPDYLDQCPNTPPGEVVDSNGCSIEQLCPCEGSWKNHGEYVECVKMVATDFHHAGLITEAQRHALLRQAEHSHCGRKSSLRRED